ncbi:hypothetical protein GCM10025886_04610 [Tetragenococcus halophilus subsp. flandriensis]|uniref:DUF3343 domain-containing protein n=1 Tax=Tetragenococcus halophilus TaxID=51669 RepID=UPI0023E911B2|nr:DUF3343 domain-containing protein [Tetragenococcus halophilus]GMA07310.1 hypothetical protein GCM10025886_04610 [Tetragenococcus halophilus subsp. flandriensis]
MECLLTFSNTHQVMKAEDVLNKQNIFTKPMPLPRALGDFCGISLRIDKKQVEQSCETLRLNHVPLDGIYNIIQKNNKKEYVPWQN